MKRKYASVERESVSSEEEVVRDFSHKHSDDEGETERDDPGVQVVIDDESSDSGTDLEVSRSPVYVPKAKSSPKPKPDRVLRPRSTEKRQVMMNLAKPVNNQSQ